MQMMHNFFRIGGLAADLHHGRIDKCFTINFSLNNGYLNQDKGENFH